MRQYYARSVKYTVYALLAIGSVIGSAGAQPEITPGTAGTITVLPDKNAGVLGGGIVTDIAIHGGDFSGARLPGTFFGKCDFADCVFRNANLDHASFCDSNLQRASFAGASLKDVDIYKSNASHASFRNAILANSHLVSNFTDADFRGAHLEQVRFDCSWRYQAQLLEPSERTTLIRADFSGADLSGAILSHADLTDTNLENAILTDVDFRRGRFRRTILNNAQLNGAVVCGVDLSTAAFKDAKLVGCIYDEKTKWPDGVDRSGALFLGRGSKLAGVTFGCKILSGSVLTHADLSHSSFCQSLFGNSDFRGANLAGSDLHGVCLIGTTLKGANLTGANLSHSDLCGADMRGVLRKCTLTGASYDRATKWPAGFNPKEHGAIRFGSGSQTGRK